MTKTQIDALVAGGLAFALLCVIGFDKLILPSASTAKLETVTPEPAPPRAKKLRLAVSKTVMADKDWDNMSALLDKLGDGYRYSRIPVRDLFDPKTFEGLDVLFLTCGDDEANVEAVANNVRGFVARGGTLYASDWRYKVVAMAFPDMVAPGPPGEGTFQELDADVIDSGLEDALGTRRVPLKFDLDQWKTAHFGGDRVKVLMKAKYKTQKESWSEAPLLVKFGFDKGTVIFTSFHNEKQNSAVEEKLLKYLVFSAVTAHIENEVNLTMLKGGFSPQKSNLFSATGASAVSNTYTSKKAGKVRFILRFDEQGARLKLTVAGPDGIHREAEGTSTVVIEENGAAGDRWTYTVTALSVPFPDFPFWLTVGEAQ